tara:strand:- start:1350 stop:1832 length:483 start_codon:yes stop_codon:yes gene_type:complete
MSELEFDLDDPQLEQLVANYEEALENTAAYCVFIDIINRINLDDEKNENLILYLKDDVYIPQIELFKAVEKIVQTALALDNYTQNVENIEYLQYFSNLLDTVVVRARARARASENSNQQAGKRRRRRRSKRNRKNKSKKQSSKTKRNRSKKRSRSKRKRT